jgi:hypothetical protein
MLARDKRSSLVLKGVTYGNKKFYNIYTEVVICTTDDLILKYTLQARLLTVNKY